MPFVQHFLMHASAFTNGFRLNVLSDDDDDATMVFSLIGSLHAVSKAPPISWKRIWNLWKNHVEI